MKKVFLIVSAFIFSIGCSQQTLSPAEVVRQYYQAFDASDYDQIKSLVSDSLTIVEGDYVMPFSHETYYEQFKWDSIFQPSYELVDIEEVDSQIIATVSVRSLRFAFLKNNPLSCRHKISVEEQRITKIENMDCIDADWALWQKERDSLVSWVQLHHPELDGFIHDLSMQGAIHYLQAIDLYEDDQNTL